MRDGDLKRQQVIARLACAEEVDDADAEFCLSLTPQQRIDMMVELIRKVHGVRPASDRTKYRVIFGQLNCGKY